MDTLITFFGWAASICMVLGYMPQAIVTMRTRQTGAIALPTFTMMGLGAIFFVVQGAMLGNWPLVVTNVITGVCSVIITAIKIHNDCAKRK